MQQEKESEERERILVEMRWGDCFKFWFAAFIVFSLPTIMILLAFIAAMIAQM